jgi:predicted DNA binding CopG/RHH family protein
MKKTYGKSLKEYEEPSYFDEEKLLKAMKKANSRRKPTSVALEEKTIRELKKLADKKNIPYQVLMRIFIIDGLNKMKKVA